jgi:hypothetical protein
MKMYTEETAQFQQKFLEIKIPGYAELPNIFLIFGYRYPVNTDGNLSDKIEKFSSIVYKNDISLTRKLIILAEKHIGFIAWDSIEDSAKFVNMSSKHS